MTDRPTFKLILQAVPDQVPAVIRLRAALKTLLRAYGLRCVSIYEVKPGTPPAAGAEPEEQQGANGP